MKYNKRKCKALVLNKWNKQNNQSPEFKGEGKKCGFNLSGKIHMGENIKDAQDEISYGIIVFYLLEVCDSCRVVLVIVASRYPRGDYSNLMDLDRSIPCM